MLRNICLLLVFFLVALPGISTAATIRLDLSADQDTYITGGTSVDIHVTVSNPSGLWDVAGAKVSATGSGLTFTYSPTSTTIHASDEEEFTITASGFIWVDTEVTITATAPATDDYEITSDSLKVTLEPLEMKLELISPESEMNIVVENASQERDVSVEALVKNTGLQDLEGVSIDLTYDETKLNCTVSGSNDIARIKTAKYPITCKSVNSGEQVLLKIHDMHGAVSEIAGIRFNFVNSGEGGELDINTGTTEPETLGNIIRPKGVNPANSWGMFRGNPMRSGYSNGTGDLGQDFLVAWTYTTADGIFGSPAVGDLNNDGKGEIIVPIETETGLQESLIALDYRGRLLWTLDAIGSVSSSPTIADLDDDGNLDITFGTNNGGVFALNGRTGKVIWKFENQTLFFRSSPLVYDADGDGGKEVYIGSKDGLYAFDGKTGTQEWVYRTEGEISSSPAVGELDDDLGLEIAFGSEEGVLYVLNSNGGLSWHVVLGASVIYSSPAVIADGKLAIGTAAGKLFIIEDKKVKATHSTGVSIGGSPGVFVADGRTSIIFGSAAEEDLHGVYTKNPDNKISCIDEAGKTLWALATDGWSVFSSPALADVDRDNKIEAVIGSREGRLYVIDAETGIVDWSYLDGTGLYASPALVDVDNDGDLEIIVAYRFSNQAKLLDSPDKPDLTIDKINFSNDFPRNGERINVTLTVKNRGRLASEGALVKFYWNTSNSKQLIGNHTVAGIAPGASDAISFPWTAYMPAEAVGIVAVADSESEIRESNEINNELYREFKGDLVLSDYEFPELKTTKAKVNLKVSATVTNKGRFEQKDLKVAVLGYNGTTTEVVKKTIDLAPNGKAKVELEFLYEPSTNTVLSLVADPDNAIDEMYEDNNAAEIILELSVEPDQAPQTTGQGSNQTIVMLLLFVVVAIIAKKVSDMRKREKRPKKEKKGKKASKKDEQKEEPKKDELAEPKPEDEKPLAEGEAPGTTEYAGDWGQKTYVVETPEDFKKKRE